MQWITARIKWIMLVSGLLTCTMVQAFFAPEAAMRAMFGTTLQGPLADIIVRNWGAFIALTGALLLYGAFRPALRSAMLVIAGLSKIIFIGLVLSFGSAYLDRQVGIAIAVDAIMVVLFACYLIASNAILSRT